MARIGSTRTRAGTIATPGGFNQPVTPSPGGLSGNRGAALGAVGRAVDQSTQQITAQLEEQRRKTLSFDALKKFGNFQSDLQERLNQVQQNAPADGAGLTAQGIEEFERAGNEFIESISPEVRDTYAERLFQMRARTQQELTRQEIGLREDDAVRTIEQQATTAMTSLLADPSGAGDTLASLMDTIDQAPLQAGRAEELKNSVRQNFAASTISAQLNQGVQLSNVAPGGRVAMGPLVDAVIQQESGGDPTARGGAGEGGLMQLMPATAAEEARALGIEDFPFSGSNSQIQQWLIDNPTENVQLGSAHLNRNLRRFGGDVEAALIAYNAGPDDAEDFLEAGRDLSVVPSVTQRYVPEVMERLGMSTSRNMASAPMSQEQIIGLSAAAALPPNITRRLLDQQRELVGAAEKRNIATAGRRMEEVGLLVGTGQLGLEEGEKRLSAIVDRMPIGAEAKRDLIAEGKTSLLETEIFAPQIQQLAEDAGFSLDEIPLDQLVTLARVNKREADRRRQEEQAREQEVADEKFFQVRAGVVEGNMGQEEIQSLIRNGVIVAGGDRHLELMNKNEQFNAERVAVKKLWDKLNRGRAIEDTRDNREAISLVAQKGLDVLRNGTSEQKAAQIPTLASLFGQTTIAPDNLIREVRLLTSSRDFDDVTTGFNVLAAMRNANPQAFKEQVPEGTRLKLREFNVLRSYGLENDVIQNFLRDEFTGDLKRIVDDRKNGIGEDLENNGITVDKVLQELGGTVSQPTLGTFQLTPEMAQVHIETRNLLSNEYRTLYDALRPKFASHGDTHDQVMDELRSDYGVFNGRMMKKPPQAIARSKNLALSEDDINEMIRQDFPVREGTTPVLRFGWAENDELRGRKGNPLASQNDPAGQMPKYTVEYVPDWSDEIERLEARLADMEEGTEKFNRTAMELSIKQDQQREGVRIISDEAFILDPAQARDQFTIPRELDEARQDRFIGRAVRSGVAGIFGAESLVEDR